VNGTSTTKATVEALAAKRGHGALTRLRRQAASLACLALAAAALGGCGGEPAVPTGDAAENIRKLALGYVQFASSHKGVGPANQEELAKAMAASTGATVEEANSRFTSPRDNKPYVIRWKQPPLGPAIGPNAPQPTLLIYEQEGAEGKRYTADGRLSIKEMSDEQILQSYPDYEKPGG
jgi:hypothetical protein